jgi:hypothetical protein
MWVIATGQRASIGGFLHLRTSGPQKVNLGADARHLDYEQGFLGCTADCDSLLLRFFELRKETETFAVGSQSFFLFGSCVQLGLA